MPESRIASVVMDAHDNLWRYYPDVGYVFLMTAPKTIEEARPTLDALNEYVGPVREVVIPDARAHVERPTRLADDRTFCACGRPWPCPFGDSNA